MEMILSQVAKVSLFYFGYNFYKYYQLTNLEKMINTSPQINLDFMPISKELEGKDCLFFGSLKDISLNQKPIDYIHLFNNYEAKNVKNYINNEKITIDIDLSLRFLEESHIELKLKKDLQYKFYDFPALKSEIVKENNQINIKLFDSYLQILYLQLRFPKEKKVLKTSYGFTKDQQILVYGTFKYGQIIQIQPKFFIGSGTVEIKEMIDFLRLKINYRLFRVMMMLSGITILHFSLNAFT